jgi:hypothetical protein
MKNIFIMLLLIGGLVTAGFIYNNNKVPANKVLSMVADEIKLTPCEPSTAFPKAAIVDYKCEKSGDSVGFTYKVKDYVLGSQTSDAGSKFCANSAQGQHIHLILNNMPYEAWYISSFKKKLADGHYVAMSFLSRSYHESIKSPAAFVLRQFNVGKDAGTKIGDIDLKQPLLFYSRPKGVYVGNETKKVLLDFYVVNTTLSAKGNKVRATINGKQFTISDWKPYYIEGLPMGESTIKLELLDKDNKPANKATMFQTIERKITLK